MKKISLIIAVLCMMIQLGFAQQLTVTGVVTSKDDGQPVIGASILVKGTTNGTITDFDGVFTLSVETDDYTLQLLIAYHFGDKVTTFLVNMQHLSQKNIHFLHTVH